MRRLLRVAFLVFMLSIQPVPVRAQSLSVRADGDQLRIDAPQLRLLTKDANDRLHDGGSIAYTFQISLTNDRNGTDLDQITYEFIFSYDLWEEKYAVTRLSPS